MNITIFWYVTPCSLVGTGKVIPALNYPIEHRAMKAYRGVEVQVHHS
jgi:hypothetical protein